MTIKSLFLTAGISSLALLSLASPAIAADSHSRLVPPQPFAPSVQTAAPIQIDGGCAAGQPILDPGFEATVTGTLTNPNWGSTSTNFGSALCDQATCGTVASAPPHAGLFWAWFGGIAAAENATVSQTLIIPATGPRFLNFWLRIGLVTTPFTDTLTVKVDGTTLRTFVEPTVAEPAYVQRVVDISAFANGASHTISFELIHPGGGGTANFNLDDVTSDCTSMPVRLQAFGVE